MVGFVVFFSIWSFFFSVGAMVLFHEAEDARGMTWGMA